MKRNTQRDNEHNGIKIITHITSILEYFKGSEMGVRESPSNWRERERRIHRDTFEKYIWVESMSATSVTKWITCSVAPLLLVFCRFFSALFLSLCLFHSAIPHTWCTFFLVGTHESSCMCRLSVLRFFVTSLFLFIPLCFLNSHFHFRITNIRNSCSLFLFHAVACSLTFTFPCYAIPFTCLRLSSCWAVLVFRQRYS